MGGAIVSNKKIGQLNAIKPKSEESKSVSLFIVICT